MIRTSLDGRSLFEEDSVFPPQWLLHSPGTGTSIGTHKACPDQVHQHCHIQRDHKICSEYRLAYFGTLKTCFVQRIIGNHSEHKEN